ncbi:hypothetical protein [Clostridium sp. MD294]|uniref:YkvI family membrane protein n=1 Tax=Clostridium sp. MD294 TaxID=97138 RepID=UPI0002C952DB|nr:hypothetical protein [Clostridium sp. MD294]NDO47171.1 hypothetical protein [Clostridium sp. MD294]USF29765.1 hypothetical protein C820_001173 [Clostridium sp. MD294]
MENKKNFFDGAFGKLILPGIVLQSVLIGGGYATGREIVEYGAKFGAMGWLAGVGTFLGFAIIAALSFELIRLYKVYDYKSFIKEIGGPLWIVFDIVYFLFMIVIIAVMASATGSIVEQTLGLNYWVGVAAITIIVGILNFFGERLIERFETYGTIALYVGYIIFAVIVISNNHENMSQVFATNDTSFVPNATAPAILWSGILYCAYNLVVVPSSFFTIKRQTKTSESIISGIIGGILMTIPWFLTYFAVMCFYPNEDVLAASVPWLSMMQGVAGPVVIGIFGIVMGWTLIETSTGIIHACIERVNNGLGELHKNKMTRPQQAILTLVILIGAMILSRIGIIDLIATVYNGLAYAFLIIYVVPLLTVGVYKIIKKHKEQNGKQYQYQVKREG